ncbi:MAG: glycosyltransferase [Acidimicrobiales bacterium]
MIVPTYNYAAQIRATVTAILADAAAFEVFVVVDGCRDGTMELLEELAARDTRLVPMFVEHVGKSGAQESALKRATGEVVLLLDQDVVPGPGLVSAHARHHLARRHLVAVGYMPTVPDTTGNAVAVLSDIYGAEYEAHCMRLEAHPELVLRQLWGGNISMLRDDCVRVGLDFQFFGHEDQDFGIRCLKAGLSGEFDRSLHAEHRHSRDLSQFLWYSKMQGASRWQIHREHSDVVGQYDPQTALEGLPRSAKTLVKLAARRGIGDLSAAVLATLGGTAGVVGWQASESRLYRLARRIELRTGAVLAAAGNFAALERKARPIAIRRAGREAAFRPREAEGVAH